MNRLRLLLATFAFGGLVAASPASAQTLTRGPLIQNPDALTTTMAIEWWTDVVGNSTVEYGTTPGLGSSLTVGQAASCEVGTAGTCHVVTLTGLSPGTRYYYRLLTNGAQVLATTYFQTFKTPTDPSEVFFSVIGDWGQGTSGQANVANNQNASDPPLLLTVGDNAYTNGTQSDWDNNAFIPEYRNQILRRAAYVPTLGNHDLNNVGASNWATSVEIKMHLLPRNAPAGQEERFFSFDYGDAHFIVLDSNPGAVNATQTNWLANDLINRTRKWTFVFLHHTPYSCANGIASLGSDLTVRNSWGPLFEQYGVDIVFDGHDHLYERSKIVDDFGADGLGTIYVMTGGGGASLDSAANADGGGPYRQPLFGSKTYCPWLSNQCPNGVAGQYCSFARIQHTEVRIQSNTTLTLKAIDQNNAVFDQFSIVKNQVCGDGILQVGEACDQGAANGTAGACCTSSCALRSAGTSCRPSGGVCDIAESCTGTSGACPTDQKSHAQCRNGNGNCDAAEFCDGSTNDCPPDSMAAVGTLCRDALGGCDFAETCDGVSEYCPPDELKPAGTECRGEAGSCDVAEVCTGSSPYCPSDTLVASGEVCRPAAGACDLAETCTGSSAACPSDAPKPAGTPCRSSAGACDPAESCTGASTACPADILLPTGTNCRASGGPCDPAESCTGSSAQCPADVMASSGTVCRPANGACDIAESCTGSSAQCPFDEVAQSATVCRAANGVCDVSEHCNGISSTCPADAFAPSTTSCRPSTGACDPAENCTGTSATCPADVPATAGTPCRAASGACDVAETCDGSAPECPANGFAPSSTVCRPASGACDVAENCTGTQASCPANAFQPATSVCRAPVDLCDAAENCSGSSAFCPSDVFKPAATQCRPAVDTCDAPESCPGTSTACPADVLRPSTFTCRPAAAPCDAEETCDGASVSCPADTGLPDGDGDGRCDVQDVCPAEPDPSQADADADGTGDVCDPCNNFLPVFAVTPKLKIGGLATGPGDDRLKLSASITVPTTPSIDPLSRGVRIVMTDVNGAAVIDATIPGGAYDSLTRAGWSVNGAGTSFSYRNAGAAFIEGIYRVTVKTNARTPGLIRFKLSGKNGSYPLTAVDLPLTASFILDPPIAETNQCGETAFSACVYFASSGSVKCQ